MIKLSDVFVRELWTSEDILNTAENIELINSGVFTQDPKVSAKVLSEDAATKIQIPVIIENSYSEPSIMDDSDNAIVPKTISKVQAQAIVGFYTDAYAEKSIVKELGSGTDPLAAAQALVGRFWNKDIFNRAIAQLNGALAANIADEASDSVIVSAATIKYGDFVDAVALAGENMDAFVAVVMHPKHKAALKKADAASFSVVPSEAGLQLEYYNDLRVFVSNKVPFAADVYTAYLLRAGAFTFAPAGVEYPVETFRNPLSGNGAGEETLLNRMAYLLHLNGYSFIGANVANDAGIPTLAELQDAANWERLVDAELTPFVAIKAKA